MGARPLQGPQTSQTWQKGPCKHSSCLVWWTEGGPCNVRPYSVIPRVSACSSTESSMHGPPALSSCKSGGRRSQEAPGAARKDMTGLSDILLAPPGSSLLLLPPPALDCLSPSSSPGFSLLLLLPSRPQPPGSYWLRLTPPRSLAEKIRP